MDETKKQRRHLVIMRLAEVSRNLTHLNNCVKQEEEDIEQSTKDIAKYQKDIKGYEQEIKDLSKEVSEFEFE